MFTGVATHNILWTAQQLLLTIGSSCAMEMHLLDPLASIVLENSRIAKWIATWSILAAVFRFVCLPVEVLSKTIVVAVVEFLERMLDDTDSSEMNKLQQ